MGLGFHVVRIERFRDLGMFPQDLLSDVAVFDDVLDFSLRARQNPTTPILHVVFGSEFVLRPCILHLNVGF